MKNFIFLTFLLFVSPLFSQDEIQVLEDYILEKYSPKEISRLLLSNEELQHYIEYYLEEENDPILEKEILELISTQFDYSNLNEVNSKFHDFSFKTGKRKFKKIRFTKPIFSKDAKYSIFYEGEKCNGLCGGGALILMEKVNGKWKEKKVLFAWIG
jgi:hypothetical protein